MAVNNSKKKLALYRPNEQFHVLSNPEFLAEGTAVRDLLSPDRILIGSSNIPSGHAAARRLRSVYETWVSPSRILTVNVWSSELAKVVANAMLAQRISSINTISAICDRSGAKIDEVAKAVGLDSRLGSKFLKAGLGFGGSCFKKDILVLTYLAHSLHLPEVADYWMSVLHVNDFQRTRFMRKVVSRLNGALLGKKMTILGYTFKQDTNDTRESPAMDIIKALLSEGPAEIAIFDPGCTPTTINASLSSLKSHDDSSSSSSSTSVLKPSGPVQAYGDVYSACADSSAILILTPWRQFHYPRTPPEEAESVESSILKLEELELEEQQQPTHKQRLSCQVDGKRLRARLEASEAAAQLNPNEDASIPARLVAEPLCASDCQLCQDSEQRSDSSTHGAMDWELVASGMREPKWVFDGRNVVDATAMAKFGFRVENIGNNEPQQSHHWGGQFSMFG
jgi:UDPglucose 6-dehydrogenase